MSTPVGPDSTVLVTGGTGSFGHTMVRRLLGSGVGEVRILSRDELKQHDMRSELDDERVRFYIGEVRDYDRVDCATRGVDYVFHAAALKQVPSCEFFPLEAVRTNVMGSSNVIEASNANQVKSVVCLGTDKAAYPVNAMGMSKAMMEKVAQAFARNNPTATTVVFTVRYGDAMMSRGSVIPTVLLVEHAFGHAEPGDLFIRKAPASTIEDLAKAVDAAMSVEPDIKIIGTRHGEKLYETLATREELARAQEQEDYFRVPVDARDLNYREYFDKGDTVGSALTDYHSHNTERLDVEGVMRRLDMLPSFRELTSA